VVHRDLCPPNVLVSRNGEVKLTDFGIARSLSDAGTSMTKSITGHVGYMAPEQARAAPFDVRADLFPVGVMAWELFTLRPCFRRDNEAASLNALLYDDVPSVSLTREDVDARWSIWIERAIARDPEQRYASAVDMLAALDVIHESRVAGGADELARLVEELSHHDDRDDPLEEPTTDLSDRDPTTLITDRSGPR
jgi:serine/threonine protein kinase